MALQQDPFDTVRAQVTTTLAAAERQHIKWGEARRRKPVRHDECKLLLTELLSSLDALDMDLGDLEHVRGSRGCGSLICVADMVPSVVVAQVLTVIEAKRSNFPHLTDAEVASRQTFVRSSRRKTLSIREDVSTHVPTAARGSSSSRARSSTPERQGLLAESSRPAGASPPAGLTPVVEPQAPREGRIGSAIDVELGGHMAMQQTQLAQQDEALDQLHGAVGRLRSLGQEMNDEISTQNRMIAELGTQVDAAADAMNSLKGKMKAMATSKDRGKYCMILALSIHYI